MIGGGDRVRLLEWLGLLFRLLFVQLSLYLRYLNRAGGQAGPPAPAACAKYYCYSQSPPAAVGLIEPARVASCSSALFAAVHGGSQEGKPALLHLRLARNITAIRSPLRQPLALSSQRESLPAPARFSPPSMAAHSGHCLCR